MKLKQTRFFASMLAALFLLALTAGCGYAAPAKKIIFRLHHNAAPGQALDDATVWLSEEMAKKTDGRLDIQVFGNSTLGSDVAARDMLLEGTLDMCVIGVGIVSNWSSAVSLLQIPYIIESPEELMAVYTSDYGKKYFHDKFLADQKVRLLDTWMQSPRQFLGKKPIHQLSDFQGVKLRIPAGMPARDAAWAKMGAMILSLGMDEAFTALQQGVCDAVEMPVDFLYAYRFGEQAKQLTMTNHTFYSLFALVNENSFNKLAPEEQQMLRDCVKEAGETMRLRLLKEDSMYLQKLQDEFGVEVTYLTPELVGQIREKVEPLYAEYMNVWGQEVYDSLMAFLKEYRQKAE